MLGGLGTKVMDMDAAVRQAMAERAYGARQQQLAGVRDDLRSRMGTAAPNYDGVGASLAERLGGSPEEYLKALKSRAAGSDGRREGLYQQAAAASDPGLLVRLSSALAGEDVGSRAVQAGVYGAAGGGVTLGLTAAGQGLMALMEYLQQGGESQQERQAPLA